MINGGRGRALTLWVIVALLVCAVARPVLSLLGATTQSLASLADLQTLLAAVLIGIVGINVGGGPAA